MRPHRYQTNDVDSDDSEDIQIEKYLTASKIYRDLWTEFYSWEQVFCQHTLEGLSKGGGVHPRSLPHDGTSIYELPAFSSSQAEEDFFIYEDTSFNSTTRFTLSPNPKILETQSFEPTAGYTACTAISTNIILKDDPASLQFAPYADDPCFKLNDYLSLAGWFTWQYDLKLNDPDFEMIQLEAVRRLRHGSGFEYDEIQSLGIFPSLRDSDRSGLIWYSSQRDFLPWPGSQMSDLNPISTNFVDHRLQIHENVLKDAKPFCPNLNCIQTHCSIHSSVKTNEMFPPKALITNEAMMSNFVNKCGDFCYKDEKYRHGVTAGTKNDLSHWSDQERSEVDSLYKLMPDTSPCDMAIICRKPCFEIYNRRKVQFSDKKILENQRPPTKSDKIKLNDDIDLFVWPATCHHEGPCNQQTGCDCYKNKQRCQRMCSCSNKCSLKFKGCRCHSKKNQKLCTLNSGCPCLESRRECNPELCLKCDASFHFSNLTFFFQKKGEKQSQHLCQNNKLQKAQFSAICIRKSKYGFGAFAAQNIVKNSYVGEYVALIHDSVNERSQMLEPLHLFTGLNYSFALNPYSVLDALSAGNETRYINDSRVLPDKDSNNESIPQPPTVVISHNNCEASIWLVNDVHRIAITATKSIKQGRELYLDYGDAYWKVHP